MMKDEAKIQSYQIIINFICPYCRLLFKVNNRETGKYVRCDGCSRTLYLTKLDLSNSSQEKDKKEEKDFPQAEEAMLQLGWTKQQARSLIKKAVKNNKLSKNIDTSELIKLAISQIETDE